MPQRITTPRILVVEDDADIAHMLSEALGEANMVADVASNLEQARGLLGLRTYDAVVLDLGLPDGNGLQLTDELRAASDVPVLILTAQADIRSRLAGFAHGADDYICKPFTPDEVVARIKVGLRRSPPEHRHLLRYAGLELDLLERKARRGPLEVVLSDREATLLAYLIRHAEEPLSRTTLAQEVWNLEMEDTGVVNVYINYLRNKLERGERQGRLIHTVRGIGYVLSDKEPE
jgi:two-component system, OmpR family, copper resistance phosphate regulon response regulator CusR